MRLPRLAILPLLALASSIHAQSVFTQRPDDPLAAYLDSFGAKGDGVADDSDALQNAINKVQESTRRGVVFVREGRYRLTKTVHVWAGIRLIGFGAKRPEFVLAKNTQGFQEGAGRYMLWFTDERVQAGQPIGDASEFTFYSALSNIDFLIEDGNPAAVAIRFNVAQHSFISHAQFRLNSARAAIEAAGNQVSDIHVQGGDYGIITGKTSPAWQFLAMDSTFTGQRQAAISTHEAGFTAIRLRIENVPVAIRIPEGPFEQLYGRDLFLRNVSRAAIELGNVQNAQNEITLESISCTNVARFAEGGGSLNPISGWLAAPNYVEELFTVGVEIGPDGREKRPSLQHRERRLNGIPSFVSSDIRSLPPADTWTNVRTVGVKGDGGTDDTAALQQAIDTHKVLYLPSGVYRLTGTLILRPDTVIIGFHPLTTQFTINDSDPAFQGAGEAIPLLLAPPNGTNIVTGFSVATGNANPRAAGLDWRAGRGSMVDDVLFPRGRGFLSRLLAPAMPPPVQGAARIPMQLDAQYPALWIREGGGGVFRDIWSPGGTAKAGLQIENTNTPGVIYQISVEHHMTKEVRIDHASNWIIYALQTEEERPEGADAIAMEIENSRDLHFANTYMYRVSRNVTPKTYAVTLRDSTNVRFSNVRVFSQTRLAFDHSVYDATSGVAVRAHDFTTFSVAAGMKPGAPLPIPSVFESKATLTKVATGFSNASGLTAGTDGTIYFTDAFNKTIYRLAPKSHAAEVVAKVQQSPMSLAFVPPSSLIAVNNEKSVSQVDVNTGAVTQLAESAEAKPGTVLLIPTGLHNELVQLEWLLKRVGYTYRQGSNTAKRSDLIPQPRGYYYAADGKTAILAGGTWRPLLQSSTLAPFAPGEQHYIVSEDDGRAYIAQLDAKEQLSTKPFVERGGTSVVSDTAGNVYIAGSQLYIYDRDGKQTGVLEIPERPSSLGFGGPDHKTLYIGARGSVYSIQVKNAGK